MLQPTISTELIRRLRHHAPNAVTDYRDAKLPGFVLRARPSGVHSWRVQLANRRWLTLGRVDEVALSDARWACDSAKSGTDRCGLYWYSCSSRESPSQIGARPDIAFSAMMRRDSMTRTDRMTARTAHGCHQLHSAAGTG